MPRMPEAEEDSMRLQSKLLRLTLLSKRRNRSAAGYSQQQIKNFAALMLHHCFFEDWAPPAQLVLVITELLQESKDGQALPKKIAASSGEEGCGCPHCNLTDTQTKAERKRNRAADLDELRLANAALGSRVGDHVSGVNTVGGKNFLKAARVEAAYPPDPSLRNPSTAPLLAIEKQTRVSRSTVRRWRRREYYWTLVHRLRHGQVDIALHG